MYRGGGRGGKGWLVTATCDIIRLEALLGFFLYIWTLLRLKLYFLEKVKTLPADWQFLSSIASLAGWQRCHLLLYLFSIENQSGFCCYKNPDNVVVSFYVLWEIYNRCMTAITISRPKLLGFTLEILIKYVEETEETELSRQLRGNPSWLVMISSSTAASQPLGLGLRLFRLLTSGFPSN